MYSAVRCYSCRHYYNQLSNVRNSANIFYLIIKLQLQFKWNSKYSLNGRENSYAIF